VSRYASPTNQHFALHGGLYMMGWEPRTAMSQKWLYIDSAYDDFETAMETVAKRIARSDPRFGISPMAKAR
jgi:hypothetical protein